jgi:hypothetical protein
MGIRYDWAGRHRLSQPSSLYRGQARERIAYTLLWGEDGQHADAWASLEELDGGTKVTLAMTLHGRRVSECQSFGAVELGLQTLGNSRVLLGRTEGSTPATVSTDYCARATRSLRQMLKLTASYISIVMSLPPTNSPFT